jgi:uncharacterized protein (TIGR01777 family)
VHALVARGDRVTALVREPDRARAKLPGTVTLVRADLEAPGPWCEALGGVDAIGHLAGEPIGGKRWDARQKQRLRDSRVESTRTIVEAIGKLPPERRPKALVCASGADYYPFASGPGDFDDDKVTEDDPPSDSFLGRLCRDWEKEAAGAEAHGLRVVSLRTGLVLGPRGGALERMVTPFKFFAGGRIGDGRQFVSWISLDDAVGVYVAALTNDSYRGPINMVTSSTRNAELSKTLGHVMHKPSWLPVPGFAVKAAVGAELAESILHGRNVVPAKLGQLGYTFEHPTLEGTITVALRK